MVKVNSQGAGLFVYSRHFHLLSVAWCSWFTVPAVDSRQSFLRSFRVRDGSGVCGASNGEQGSRTVGCERCGVQRQGPLCLYAWANHAIRPVPANQSRLGVVIAPRRCLATIPFHFWQCPSPSGIIWRKIRFFRSSQGELKRLFHNDANQNIHSLPPGSFLLLLASDDFYGLLSWEDKRILFNEFPNQLLN